LLRRFPLEIFGIIDENLFDGIWAVADEQRTPQDHVPKEFLAESRFRPNSQKIFARCAKQAERRVDNGRSGRIRRNIRHGCD
jgi:hypothetical protein